MTIDAMHVSSIVKKVPEFDASIKGLEKELILVTVQKAVAFLINDHEHISASRTTRMVIAVLEQWLITYLCERLLQLMTPETLIINHRKIPSHYMDIYLNQQSHFNLRTLIGNYHAVLSSSNSAG